MKLERYGMIGHTGGLNLLRSKTGEDCVGRETFRKVAACEDHEDARIIAHRYNLHEDMVSALEAIQPHLDYEHVPDEIWCMVENILKKAKAV